MKENSLLHATVTGEGLPVILLHGLLPPLSYATRTERSRHAYSLHLIDATAEYPDDNWLRRGPEMPLKGF